MTSECNATPQCGYCLNREKLSHPDIESIRGIIKGLAKLDGEWRISITGGEPTHIPGFSSEIVPFFLRETQHLCSLVTNFTAEERCLIELVDMLGCRLERLCASYHLGLTKPDEFIGKAVGVNEACLRNDSAFKVFCVLLPSRLDYIGETLAPRLREAGLEIYFQLLKVLKGGRLERFSYNDEQMQKIRAIVGSESTAFLNPSRSYKGHQCSAGMNYLVMEPSGDVYTCYDDRDRGVPPIGNMGQGIGLNTEPIICQNEICSCGSPFLDGNIKT